jgi:hypothetical protein
MSAPVVAAPRSVGAASIPIRYKQQHGWGDPHNFENKWSKLLGRQENSN